MTLRLSVLDQAPISEGSTGSDALRNSVDLARLAAAIGPISASGLVQASMGVA